MIRIIDFKKMPKVNLHHHLEGAMRPATFLEMGIKNGFFKTNTKLEEIRHMLQVDGSEKNLLEYLRKVDITVQVLDGKRDLSRLAQEIVQDAYENGVEYLELRGGPTLHCVGKLYTEEVIESILEGLKEGEKETGIMTNFIVTALRHEETSKNKVLAKIAGKYAKYGVVGFDLAGDEIGYPAREHQAIFEIAREQGLGITVHAGEVVGYESVKEAIELLGATRIGHGITSIQSEALLDVIREKEILLEVCPTSNVDTKAVANLKEHPIRKLFDKKVLISVADDDPTTSNIYIPHELEVLNQHFGFTVEEIIELQYNGIDKAFLSIEKKIELKKRFDEKMQKFI